MRLIFFSIVFLVNAPIFSQINKGAFDDYLYFVNQSRPAYEGVEGTPYLSEDFVPARIDDFEKVIYIKFNVFANNIELKKADGEVAILSLERDYKFKVLDAYNTTYEIHNYEKEEGLTGRSFFKKLGGGEHFQLFLKPNVKYTPKKIATSGFEQNQPARFAESKPTFFVRHPKEGISDLMAVPSRKKELAAFFDKKSKLVQQYIKKERLKLDNEEDLIKLFNYYWSEK